MKKSSTMFLSFKNWLNEKFTKDSDPIHDMGIGIRKYLKPFSIMNNRYLIYYDVEKDYIKTHMCDDLNDVYNIGDGNNIYEFPKEYINARSELATKENFIESGTFKIPGTSKIPGTFKIPRTTEKFYLYQTPLGKILKLVLAPAIYSFYYVADFNVASKLYIDYILKK